MRRAAALLLAALVAGAPGLGRGQNAPPPPPTQPAPTQPAPTQPAPTQPEPAEPAPAQPAWLPRQVAELVALDKISARTTRLSVEVGQSASFRTLTIAVRACYVRPPDQAADATAWLDITDTTPGAPSFHGWMIASAPAVSGLQHPTYDVRLAGCR